MSIIPGYCKRDGCESPAGRTGFCESCLKGLRDIQRDLNRPVKPHKTIRKISEKQKERLQLYSYLRDGHLRMFPDCQLKLVGCTGRATEVHHSAKRGKNLNNKETFLSACHHCHVLVEAALSAKERREKGFLKTV